MNRIQNETGQQAVKVVSLRIWSAEEDSGAFHGERALAAPQLSMLAKSPGEIRRATSCVDDVNRKKNLRDLKPASIKNLAVCRNRVKKCVRN